VREKSGTTDGFLASRNILEISTKAISACIMTIMTRCNSLREAFLVMLIEYLLVFLHAQGGHAVVREFAPALSSHEDLGDLYEASEWRHCPSSICATQCLRARERGRSSTLTGLNPYVTIDGEQLGNCSGNIGDSIVHTANGWSIFSAKTDLEGSFNAVLVRCLRVRNLVQEFEIGSKSFRE